MLFRKCYFNDEILQKSSWATGVHYFHDGDDLVFTYKDSSKRSKIWLRYPKGLLRIKSEGGEYQVYNPLSGLTDTELNSCIAVLENHHTSVLFGSGVKFDPRPGVKADFSVTFDMEEARWIIFSVSRKTIAKEALARDLAQLRCLGHEAIFTDCHKPNANTDDYGRMSVTRYFFSLGDSTDGQITSPEARDRIIAHARLLIEPRVLASR